MSSAPHIENFETISLLGRGGMAAVWKARQSSLDRMVAIKVLSAAFTSDPADVARFREEARSSGRLKHPGIVQVYDANFNNGSYYFVMELVDGYTIGEWIRRKGRLNEADALTVAESVIIALDYAWASFSIIHCDIKPENIMVDADGSVKVADLGLARAIVAMHSKEQEKEVLGTPAYMSPEQVTGQPDLDCRADIYALGATLYHMVTGHPLFAGEKTDDVIMRKQLIDTVPCPSHEAPKLSRNFLLLLAQLLSKDRANRPHDWKVVLGNIRRVRAHNPPVGPEPAPGASTILLEARRPDTGRQPVASASAAATPGNDDGARVVRLSIWLLLTLAMGFAIWWFAVGRPPKLRPQVNVPVAALTVEQQYKAALAYVIANPGDWSNGIARLDAVLAWAPDSWYAQQARVQRDRLTAERENVLQEIYSKLDAQARDLVSRSRTDEALLLLEKYEGPYPAETLPWRREQAQMLRGGQTAVSVHVPNPVPVPRPGPEPTPTPAPPRPPTPSPIMSPSRPEAITEKEGAQKMARALLKGEAVAVFLQAAELAAMHPTWSKGEFALLQKLLRQARDTEMAMLNAFAQDTDKEISVALLNGSLKGIVGEIVDGRVHLKLASGADRSFTLNDLDFSERLKRLRSLGARGNGEGATLLKALWAYRAHATDRAKMIFASLPDPVGTVFVQLVDEKP
ncbi:MAG: serine/threonine protein kinase [Kiritimatiellia bacterium]